MRLNWRTGTAAAVLAAALAGCAPPPPGPIYRDMWASVPAPEAGRGRLVFYRSQARLGGVSGAQVIINEQPAGTMPNGG